MNKELSKEEILRPHILNDYGHFSAFNHDYKLSIAAIKYAMEQFSDQEKKKILDNPELYGLVKNEKYDELMKENQTNFMELGACISTREDLEKENKELKEKITELEEVIAQQRTEPCSE